MKTDTFMCFNAMCVRIYQISESMCTLWSRKNTAIYTHMAISSILQ